MDGIVTLLKPPGMTSNNAVYDVRRIFSEKRVGHLGTLDPGAAGVLPVCLGRATRLFDLLVDKEKSYRFEVHFGMATDSEDAYGRVTESSDKLVSEDEILAVLGNLTGEIQQTAPVYSALKVNGQKMCDLARRGVAVEPKTRSVTVKELKLLEKTGENRFLLDIVCSRGTYVRTVASDLGRLVGCPAYMSLLIRTSAGIFTLNDAYSVQELEALREENRLGESVISCETALSAYPKLELPAERRKAMKNGLETYARNAADGTYRIYADGFLGVGTVTKHSAKLTVHLYDEN